MPSSVLLVGNTFNDYTLEIPPPDTPTPAEPSISLGPIADANMMIRGYPNPIAELFKVQEMLGGGTTAKVSGQTRPRCSIHRAEHPVMLMVLRRLLDMDSSTPPTATAC